MEVFQVKDKLPDSAEPIVLVIGKFDGVHKGHQYLLEKAKSFCENGEKLAIVCFTPHPLWALKKDPAYKRAITPDAEKFLWLAHFGVDKVYNIEFDVKYAENSAEVFVREHLRGLNLRHIVVGESFNFGKGRDSDVDLLINLCGERAVPVTEVPFIRDGTQHKISSTDIRAALYEGDFEKAEQLLGHPYFMEGKVGDENRLIDMDEFVIPKPGKYEVLLNGEEEVIQISNNGDVIIPKGIVHARIQFLISFYL
ncbi:adenylyltransferase/cytidyltransferase family protein [Listeria weihenstephanensis]|uniref:FAD synthase n=1 Tax=Listeria weihenstephanensis TaxID=1006155 RepID=A0A841Z3X9_9LIST|nr:adenylyltransferase/cytidyltransferase family protein [Listeria weihenstephanensis]MBC1500621.1 adenylyltransferase/cytidyltransferase family protein [Listeria weihenstephanensis]